MVKHKVLRTLNSGFLLSGIIVVSGVLIALTQAFPYTAPYAGGLATFLITLAALIVAHKIRRIALRLNALDGHLRQMAQQTAEISKTVSANETAFAALQSLGNSVQAEVKRLARAPIASPKFDEKIAEVLGTALSAVAATTPSLPHSQLSAQTVAALQTHNLSSKAESIEVIGGGDARVLAEWLSADAASAQTVVEYPGSASIPIELPVIDTLLIDLTTASPYRAHSIDFAGELLPGAEIWILGSRAERHLLYVKLTAKDSNISQVMLGRETRHITLARKVST